MKLYRVEVETELYCLAESEKEAIGVARRHFHDEEPHMSARVADYVEGDWYDGLPYHARPEIPDKSCAEWMRELNQKAS